MGCPSEEEGDQIHAVQQTKKAQNAQDERRSVNVGVTDRHSDPNGRTSNIGTKDIAAPLKALVQTSREHNVWARIDIATRFLLLGKILAQVISTSV